MRKLLFAVSALSLIALPAMAADLGPFYRAPIPVAVLDWTGPYVGATLGGARTDSNVTEATGATFCNPALVGCAAGPAFSSALAAAVPGTFGTSGVGIIGGGEFGYNWQSGQFVLGFEADISGSTISGSELLSGASVVVGFPANTVGVSGSANAKVDYLGTVRGRAGYLCDRRLGLWWRFVEHHAGGASCWSVFLRFIPGSRWIYFDGACWLDGRGRRRIHVRPALDGQGRVSLLRSRKRDLCAAADRADNGDGHSVLRGDRRVARRLHRQCRTGRRELRVLICEAVAVRVLATELCWLVV
jgi:hypothetical protein